MALAGTEGDDTLVALARVWPRLSENLQSAIVGIVESPEVSLRRGLEENSLQPELKFTSNSREEEDAVERFAHSLACRCRSIVQACLREEEWLDVDSEFFAVILDAIRNLKANIV